MKQQVNLYLSEFRIKRDNLTVVLMLQILGIALALIAVLSATDYWRSFRLNSQLVALRDELAVETQKTREIDSILARRSQDANLTERLSIAEDVLNASRQIRNFFDSRSGGNIDGFSEYLKDLSRAAVEGLWITEFSLTGGGSNVLLKGFATDSAMIPTYVARLGEGQSPLVNRHFSFSTSRSGDGEQLYNFELNTSR